MGRRSYPKPPRKGKGEQAEPPPQTPYDFAKVPNCVVTADGIPGSVLQRVVHRDEWLLYTRELVGVSHEAGRRRAEKTGVFRGIHHDHAELERLSYAFILERTETDDPMKGYVIRSDDNTRRLQGFCWYTTFTTWTHYFKWDTFSDLAGLAVQANSDGISWDSDGSLAHELEQTSRGGDPYGEGIIWPRVGEVSLVGALECGGFLVQLVLEEMEASNQFDYVVVQATESSAGFYDKMGFRRVGALAKYASGGDDPDVVDTVAYRHWTYPDEDTRTLDSSIMMALRLGKGEVPRRVLVGVGGILPHVEEFARGRDGYVAARGHNVPELRPKAQLQGSVRCRQPFHPWRAHAESSECDASQRKPSHKRKRSPSSPPSNKPSHKKKPTIETPPPKIVTKSGRNITPSSRLMSSRLWVSPCASPRTPTPTPQKRSQQQSAKRPSPTAARKPSSAPSATSSQRFRPMSLRLGVNNVSARPASRAQRPPVQRCPELGPELGPEEQPSGTPSQRAPGENESPQLLGPEIEQEASSVEGVPVQKPRKTRKSPFSGQRIRIRPKGSSHLAAGSPGALAVAAALRWKNKGRVMPPAARALDLEVKVPASFEEIMCGHCQRGDDEQQLLLCDTCDAGWHTYCMDPPMKRMPAGAWHCSACLEKKARSLARKQAAVKVQKVHESTSRGVKDSGVSKVRTMCSRRLVKPVERFKARSSLVPGRIVGAR